MKQQRSRARVRSTRPPVRHGLLLVPLGLAIAGGAMAQTAQLPTVGITATRLAVTPSGLAQSVTVIDQREIQETQPSRLEDLLSRLTGVHVDSAGAVGGFSSLYLRGAENSHLLVMVDGVKVNDPTTTRGSAYDLSSIDVSQIDRIELLRGPASAIHGGEALAGVLNIITRKSTSPGLSGSAYGAVGGDRHRKLGASVSMGGEVLRAQLSVGTARDGGRSEDASQRVDSASGSLHFAPGPRLSGELFVHRVQRDSEAFPDDSGGPRLAVVRDKTRRNSTDTIYGASLAAGDPTGLQFQAGASVYKRSERADNAFIDAGVRFPVPAFVSDTDFRRSTVNASLTQRWDRASLVVGVERQTERGGLASAGDFDFDGNPDDLRFSLERRTDSIFGEGRFQLGSALTLQVGVRRDKVEGLDSQTTPHLGLLWALPNGSSTLKANYNKGFKPPSFFALGFPIGGNPDLKPERSQNAELAFVQRLDGVGSSLDVSVFRITYTDLVDFTIDPNTFVPLNVNRGTVLVKGIEPALKLQIGERLRTQIGLTLLDINEKDGLAPLRNRPEKRATASALYRLDAASSVYGVVSYTGRFLDRSNPTGDLYLPGFTTVDLAYSIRLGALRAKFAIDNLFDKSYEQFVGFPARERRLRIELRTDF